MENWKKKIGQKIRKRRIEKGFSSQGKLAEKLEIDTARVSDWERGEHIPAKHKAKLFKILEIDDLYLREEEEKPAPTLPTKNDLISAIVIALPTLDESELEEILSHIDSAPSRRTLSAKSSID